VTVRNVDSTNNSRAIIHQVEVNVYYKNHIKRIRIDVYDPERTNIILSILWFFFFVQKFIIQYLIAVYSRLSTTSSLYGPQIIAVPLLAENTISIRKEI